MSLLWSDVGFSAMTAILSAAPAPAPVVPPPEFDVLIRAADFARGSVKPVRHGGWADGPAIILCANQSPDWAEWPFAVAKPGAYRVFARFAAAVSRPVDVSIDAIPVAKNALTETTGSWKSSSARWFPVGVVLLEPGDHVLRIQRPTCIPHIVAFGLRYAPEIDLSKGALALPEELWMRDQYRIQDWMIWTIGGIEQYSVKDHAYRIVNGAHAFNRPMYGTNGPETVFAGDRPMLLFTRGPKTKLGAVRLELVAGAKRKWLDEAARVEFVWNGAWAEWTATDPLLDKAPLRLTAVPLPNVPGYILRIDGPRATDLDLWLGGIRDGYLDNRAGFGPMPVGDLIADTADNEVTVDGPRVEIRNPGVAGGVCTAVIAPDVARKQTWRAESAKKGRGGQAARISIPASSGSVFVAVAVESADLDAVRTAPANAWESACRHYEEIADRLRTDTPSAVLDAAVRGNNTAMDGEYRPPSFLHGALRWGTECNGWYLGWRGWYGPIMAGDWERVRGAAEMHLKHQFQEPETGLRSRGKIANFVSFDGNGSDTHTGYNMQEVFLDHLRMYLNWTGDSEFLVEQWPRIKKAIAYEDREIGRGLDGLYTNAVNTWISDGHHYNGCACTQGSAYAVARNRFAAEVARRAGEDPSPYRQRVAETLREMNKRLWMPAKGYFAEYVDQDGILHDAAEAPTVYHPIEMGAADPFQAYQMTRYMDERLWRFGDQILANDWFPVIVTNGLIGFNESLNTALAYYYAGRFDRAWRLLEVCCKSMAKAAVPGSISCYGSRKGEQGTYIDFTDASSLLARTVVEGLFGLRPRVDLGRVAWAPGFPIDWDRATFRTRGFKLEFSRRNAQFEYVLETDRELSHSLRLPLDCASLAELTVNGKGVSPHIVPGIGRPYLDVETGAGRRTVVRFTARGELPRLDIPAIWVKGGKVRVESPDGVDMLELRDPQGVSTAGGLSPRILEAVCARDDGPHTVFMRLRSPLGEWWQPINVRCTPALEFGELRIAAVRGVPDAGLRIEVLNHLGHALHEPAHVRAGGMEWEIPLDVSAAASQRLDLVFPDPGRLLPGHTPVSLEVLDMTAHGDARLWRLFDAFPEQRAKFASRCRLLDFARTYALGRVFTRKYPSGQGPVLNNWTWYDPKTINANALRERARNGVLTTRVGVPFAVRTAGKDTLFLSRWKPFPKKAVVPVGVRADRLYLLLANHTHNSQTHLVLARVVLVYADGAREIVPLRSPHDIDGMLQHYSDMAPEWIGGKDQGWYGHGRASGVHADVTDIATDPTRELSAFELECVARETLIGLLGATVHVAR